MRCTFGLGVWGINLDSPFPRVGPLIRPLSSRVCTEHPSDARLPGMIRRPPIRSDPSPRAPARPVLRFQLERARADRSVPTRSPRARFYARADPPAVPVLRSSMPALASPSSSPADPCPGPCPPSPLFSSSRLSVGYSIPCPLFCPADSTIVRTVCRTCSGKPGHALTTVVRLGSRTEFTRAFSFLLLSIKQRAESGGL